MIHQTVHNYYSGVLNLLFVVSIRFDKTKHLLLLFKFTLSNSEVFVSKF